MAKMIQVDLCLNSPVVARWSARAQKGLILPFHVGKNLAEILTQQLGMDPEYLETVVRTVFHNSSPVDALDTAIVADGDMVALAGAMPGLVGIAMGRNSPVGGFRSDISNRTTEAAAVGMGRVIIKGFNVVVPELVKLALAHGVIVEAAEAAQLLDGVVGAADQESLKGLACIRQSKGEILLVVNWRK